MDDLDELVGRATRRLFVGVGIDEMGADVVLQYDGEEPVHCPAAARDLLQHVGASLLLFERPLDGFDLPLDATNPVEQLLLFANRMAHI